MMTNRVAMRGRLPALGTLPAVHAVHLPVLAGAWLLVGAGLYKTWRPAPTARAVRTVLRGRAVRPAPTARAVRTVARGRAVRTVLRGRAVRTVLRGRAVVDPAMARGLGLLELVVGVGVLASPWAVAVWAQSGMYAMFAVFVVLALATGAPRQSCGCFGAADKPPSLIHVAIDSTIAGLGVAAVTDDALGSAHSSLVANHGSGALWSLALAGAAFVVLRGRAGAGSVTQR